VCLLIHLLHCFISKKMTINLVSYRLAIRLLFDSPMYTFISIRKMLNDWLSVIHYLVCILYVLYFEIFIYLLFRLLVMKKKINRLNQSIQIREQLFDQNRLNDQQMNDPRKNVQMKTVVRRGLSVMIAVSSWKFAV